MIRRDRAVRLVQLNRVRSRLLPIVAVYKQLIGSPTRQHIPGNVVMQVNPSGGDEAVGLYDQALRRGLSCAHLLNPASNN